MSWWGLWVSVCVSVVYIFAGGICGVCLCVDGWYACICGSCGMYVFVICVLCVHAGSA